jgi:protein-S-isoprenylcysteine O-methyltransferase Ste14
VVVMVIFANPTVMSLGVGFTFVVLGELIRFWGVAMVGAETRTTGTVGGTYLITSGPYALVRNPLYVGNMLLYAGVGIMSMALFPWLLIVAVAWFYLQYSLIVRREEEYLAARFGTEYETYCRNVPRFFPRPVPYHSPQPPPRGTDPSEGLASERRTLQAIGLVTLALIVIYLLKSG